MDDILIYTGLTILILGSVYGIYAAVKGCREQGFGFGDILTLNRFNRTPTSPAMKRRITIWAVIMAVGFIVTGIGIATGLN